MRGLARLLEGLDLFEQAVLTGENRPQRGIQRHWAFHARADVEIHAPLAGGHGRSTESSQDYLVTHPVDRVRWEARLVNIAGDVLGFRLDLEALCAVLGDRGHLDLGSVRGSIELHEDDEAVTSVEVLDHEPVDLRRTEGVYGAVRGELHLGGGAAGEAGDDQQDQKQVHVAHGTLSLVRCFPPQLEGLIIIARYGTLVKVAKKNS